MSAPAHSAKELLESWGDIVPTFDSDLYDYTSNPYGTVGRYQRPATTLFDRGDGRFLPVYQTEFDLAVIRSMGRTLAVGAPGLVGGLRNMCNYTIGEGFKFTATRETNADLTEKQCEPLLKVIQIEVAKFLDQNDFVSGFDREIHDTSIIDGESFLYLQPDDDCVRVSRCEPDQIREPANSRELEDWIQGAYGIECDGFVSSWSFGVHTRADALGEPLGYHVVADESGVNWEYVPADRMVHIKRNVTRNAKRGFSDFYPIEADSARGEKLRRNMAEGAAIQSAIAFVRQHVAGTTRTGVETMLGENKSATQYPTTFNGLGRPKNIVQYRPGTVVDLSAGLEYKPGPLGSERANDFLLVASYVQRMQAVRWSMPEYMFSGDASNANYASTMEATAPFVKSCEAEQRFYSRYFVALIWKALKLRWESGAFDKFDYEWERIEQSIKLTADCPEVATRDELANVQRQQILITLGILSRKTAAAQNGLDYEAEVANGAAAEGQGSQSNPTGTRGGTPADGPPVKAAQSPGNGNAASNGEDDTADLATDQLGESLLFECGGRGGKHGPCPKHKADLETAEDRGAQRPSAEHNRNSTTHPDAPPQSKAPWSAARAAPLSSSAEASTSNKVAAGKAAISEMPSPPAEATSKQKESVSSSDPVPETTPDSTGTKAKKKNKPNTLERQQYAAKGQKTVARIVRGDVVEDNAPADVRTQIKGKVHLMEVKTMLDRQSNDIHMSKSAVDRKAKVTADTGHEFHTVVLDRRNRFSKGPHNDLFEHPVYYKRGAGSSRLDQMHKVESLKELRHLMSLPDHLLPPAARPHANWRARVKAAKGWKSKGRIRSAIARLAQEKANKFKRTFRRIGKGARKGMARFFGRRRK